MLKFAANLQMLYPEHAFLDRFDAAAQDGFKAVEFFFPYPWPAPVIAERLRRSGLQLVLFNATPRADERERGIAALAGREDEFREGFLRALDYAGTLECDQLHVMAGLIPPGSSAQDIDAMRARFADNLAWAADQARAHGRRVLIEPINTRDMPGYLVNRQAEAHDIIARVGADNLKVQMDLYHCQIVEGDVETQLRRYLPTGRVGHLQIAGVPARHEPDLGELNVPYLLQVVQSLAWPGHVGCEYHPRRGAEPGGTSAGLQWLREWERTSTHLTATDR